MPDAGAWLTIGEVARRSGVAPSALRFYEEQGLIGSARSAGRQRRYARQVLRRVAFIRVAQSVGLNLAEIRRVLAALPDGRTPNRTDWARLARGWQPLIDERIAALERLRGRLTSCIGCGCLSLKVCRLYNPDDAAGERGAGARYLAGDAPPKPAGRR